MGWITRDSEVERDYWRRCRRPTARFFVEQNPGYTNGHGLLTLVPLDHATIGRSLARWSHTRLKKLSTGWLDRSGPHPDEDLEILQDSAELEGASRAALRALLHHATRTTVPPGTTLIRQGELGDTFFITLRGSAFVYIGHEQPVLVDQTTEGEVFGGMAVLADQPRSATVKAVTKMDLLVLTRATLVAVLQSHPELRAVLWRNVSRDRFDSLVQTLPRYAALTRQDRFTWFARSQPAMSGAICPEGRRIFLYEGRAELSSDTAWNLVSAPALVDAAGATIELTEGSRARLLPQEP